MLLAMTCGATSFAIDVVTIMPDNSLNVLPGEIAKDGKTFLYSYTDEMDYETRETHYYVYDEDFKVVKEFVTISVPGDEYSYQRVTRQNIPVSATVERKDHYSVPFEIDGEAKAFPIETVLKTLKEEGAEWEIVTLEDGSQVVAAPEYFESTYFGKKYPKYYYGQGDDNLWYYFMVSYDVTRAPYGEWGEPRIYQSTVRYAQKVYVNITVGIAEDHHTLTRGVFCDDVCYVLPEYRKVEFNNEYTYEDTDWVYEKVWGYRSEIRAFKAYDSSGNVVATIEIPDGYSADSQTLDFFKLNEKRYITIDIMKPGTTEYGYDEFTVVYRLDGDSNVTRVAITPSTKVSPRAPKQGERVTVSFDESSIGSQKTINVVSLSGRNVYSTKLPAGESSIDIDTSRLSQGMYVVTVSADGKNQEAAKIIVR